MPTASNVLFGKPHSRFHVWMLTRPGRRVAINNIRFNKINNMDQPRQFEREEDPERGEVAAIDDMDGTSDDQRSCQDGAGSESEEDNSSSDEENDRDDITDRQRSQWIQAILQAGTQTAEARGQLLDQLVCCIASLTYMVQWLELQRQLFFLSRFLAEQIIPRDEPWPAQMSNLEHLQRQSWTRIISGYETLPAEASAIQEMIPCISPPTYTAQLAQFRLHLTAAVNLANLGHGHEENIEFPRNSHRPTIVANPPQPHGLRHEQRIHAQAGAAKPREISSKTPRLKPSLLKINSLFLLKQALSTKTKGKPRLPVTVISTMARPLKQFKIKNVSIIPIVSKSAQAWV
jgi:hypothetical protein